MTGLLMICGGFCAWVFAGPSRQSAFYVGITWPITVSAIASHVGTAKYLANAKGGGPTTKHPLSYLVRTHANGLFKQSPED